MFCEKCGAKLDAEDQFCQSCGTKVKKEENDTVLVDNPIKNRREVENISNQMPNNRNQIPNRIQPPPGSQNGIFHESPGGKPVGRINTGKEEKRGRDKVFFGLMGALAFLMVIGIIWAGVTLFHLVKGEDGPEQLELTAQEDEKETEEEAEKKRKNRKTRQLQQNRRKPLR